MITHTPIDPDRAAELRSFLALDALDPWQAAAVAVADQLWPASWRAGPNEVWRWAVEDCRRFFVSNRHGFIRRSFTEPGNADTDLGEWVREQRRAYREGKLTAGQIAELETVDGWDWWPGHTFKLGLAAVRTYSRREGHAQVPLSHVEGTFELGLWVARTRYAHRQIREDHVTALAAADVGWTWRATDHFAERLQALELFAAREGHTRVPAQHFEHTVHLGHWVAYIRNRKRSGRLRAEDEAALTAVDGWQWTVPRGSVSLNA